MLIDLLFTSFERSRILADWCLLLVLCTMSPWWWAGLTVIKRLHSTTITTNDGGWIFDFQRKLCSVPFSSAWQLAGESFFKPVPEIERDRWWSDLLSITGETRQTEIGGGELVRVAPFYSVFCFPGPTAADRDFLRRGCNEECTREERLSRQLSSSGEDTATLEEGQKDILCCINTLLLMMMDDLSQ